MWNLRAENPKPVWRSRSNRHTQQRSSSCFLPGTIGKQLSAISKQLDTIGIIGKHLGSVMDLVAILIFTGFAVGFFIIAAEDFG